MGGSEFCDTADFCDGQDDVHKVVVSIQPEVLIDQRAADVRGYSLQEPLSWKP